MSEVVFRRVEREKNKRTTTTAKTKPVPGGFVLEGAPVGAV